jgi:Fur family ferric uptake transcriptional regulator
LLARAEEDEERGQADEARMNRMKTEHGNRPVSKEVQTDYDSHKTPDAAKPEMNSSDELKSSGLKATLPRLRILKLFETSSLRHMSADDIYRLLMQDGLDIGLATVYRVLTQFEQAGLLKRHHFEGGKAVFELNQGGHHDHLVCMQCGRVEEFYDPEIERRQESIARERGFTLHEHSLYLYVDCGKPDCPSKAGPRSA